MGSALFESWRISRRRRWSTTLSRWVLLTVCNILYFEGLHPSAADWLIARREIAAIGIDTMSIDGGSSIKFECHQKFANANIPIVESMRQLQQLPSRGADVIVLPMKITGGSGGPVRAIALLSCSTIECCRPTMLLLLFLLIIIITMKRDWLSTTAVLFCSKCKHMRGDNSMIDINEFYTEISIINRIRPYRTIFAIATITLN